MIKGNGSSKYVIITSYTGSEKILIIPSLIEGLPVTRISSETFKNKQLTDISIPDTVTYIGDDAFRNNSLTDVTIPDTVTYIGSHAFRGNLLTKIILPSKLTVIGFYAFSNNQISDIIFPPGIIEIKSGAFANNNLTSINIPKGKISDAFNGNPITEVFLPDGIINMYSGAPFSDLFSYLAIHGNRPGKYTLKDSRWLYNGEYMSEAVILSYLGGLVIEKIDGKNPETYEKYGNSYYLPQGTHTFIVRYDVHYRKAKEDTKLSYTFKGGKYSIWYEIKRDVIRGNIIVYSIKASK
jgi:hypothetical protein